jgi:hypothetical protein
MKETKIPTEISRDAHTRDCGAAVIPLLIMIHVKCDTFGWLENMMQSGHVLKESDVPAKLTEFQKLFVSGKH